MTNLDDYGRTPEERKVWLKESKKYWEIQHTRLIEKIGALQKQLLYFEKDFQQAEVILKGINSEIRKGTNA